MEQAPLKLEIKHTIQMEQAPLKLEIKHTIQMVVHLPR